MLTDGGINYELLRVDTRTDFITALKTQVFDLILAAYALPDFDGIAALETARNLRPETPFIFVSASLGEELAIEALKRGATDYVLKQRLERLVPCVQRALREAKERSDRQGAEAALHQNEARLRAVAANLPNAAVFLVDTNLRYVLAEGKALAGVGMTSEDLVGKTLWSALDPALANRYEPYYRQALGGEPFQFEHNSHDRHYISHGTPLYNNQGEVDSVLVVSYDISDRKRVEDERKQAEAAQRESEERYRTLFESTDEGFCVVEVLFDPAGTPCDHRILRANPAFERQTGITNPEGKRASELAPGIEQYWNDLYAQVVNTGESIRIENRSDALERWFDVLVSPVGDGAMHQVALVFSDISDRKRAENTQRQTSAELERQLRKLDAIASSVPDFIYTFDLSGRFTYISQSLLDLWQKTSAEAMGKNFFELDYPEDLAARLQNQIQQVIETRQPLKDETPYTSAVGTRAYEYIFVPMFDATGSVEAVAGVTRDITDRKQTEAALRDSEERFRTLADNMSQFAWMTDENGWIFWYNRRWFDYTKTTLEEMQGWGWQKVHHPDHVERVVEHFRRCLETGQEWEDTFPLRSKDGTYRWFLSRAIPIRDQQGRILRWFGTNTDISDRVHFERDREQILQQEQAARAEAERANRIKDEFLAVLSHELRSPLNPILGWTRLLQNGKLDEARRAEALKTIERNARLQSQLIEDLLDISRIMQGKLTLNAAPVSLSFVISAALETVRLAAEAKNVRFALDLDSEITPISGDAARLQQVVWNLLTNAVKFTPNGGQVTVELRHAKRLAQIRVIDTGIGIKAQFLPYVFEYFRQEDGSTTRRFGGLGLGLAIARQIVEMHGGTVTAESQGENQGATFIVQLPLALQVAPFVPEQTIASTDTAAPLDNRQILLVDDDTDTREFQAFLLEQSGADVTAVASGLEALQAMDKLIPDVIVSDIGMAQMDGYMLIGLLRLRPAERGGKIPAIALTAYAAEVDKQKALQAGFQTFLTKPVEPESLIKAIVNLFDGNQQ